MPRAKKSAAARKSSHANAGAATALSGLAAAAQAPESAAPGAAVLAVDLQTSLLGALPRELARGVTRRAGLALAAATGLHIPVFFSEQVPAKLGGTAPKLRALAPAAPVFAKSPFSAVADEPLLAALRAASAEHLLLVGLETPVCIYQTALGARAEGFEVTVLSDAVGARRADDHAACLAALRHAGVHVLPVETVFYALLHDAAHPFFKPFTALVKAHA